MNVLSITPANISTPLISSTAIKAWCCVGQIRDDIWGTEEAMAANFRKGEIHPLIRCLESNIWRCSVLVTNVAADGFGGGVIGVINSRVECNICKIAKTVIESGTIQTVSIPNKIIISSGRIGSNRCHGR